MKYVFTTVVCLFLIVRCQYKPKQLALGGSVGSDILTDTMIDGDRIIMEFKYDSLKNMLWLQVHQNNFIGSVELKSYSDYQYDRDGLWVLESDSEVRKTWVAKVKDAIVFVLPYHPGLGLYAYQVKDGEIRFYLDEKGNPPYADEMFWVKPDADIVVACMIERFAAEYGGTLWKLSATECRFFREKDILKGVFSDDSTRWDSEVKMLF